MDAIATRKDVMVVGLIGLLVGALLGAILVTTPPADAANGDIMFVGQKNNAIRRTRLVSKGGLALDVGKAGNPALTLNVTGDTPPLAVNSTAKVINLNADLLDGKSADHLKSTWAGKSNDNIPDAEVWEHSATIEAPRAGELLMTGSISLENTGTQVDTVFCAFSVDNVHIPGSSHGVTVPVDGWATCATDAWVGVWAGSYDVAFYVWSVAVDTNLDEGAFWATFVPD